VEEALVLKKKGETHYQGYKKKLGRSPSTQQEGGRKKKKLPKKKRQGRFWGSTKKATKLFQKTASEKKLERGGAKIEK